MTQYRLDAVVWWQEIDRTVRCGECGAVRGDEVVERVKHHRGDIVDVTGSEEARLLDAGALAPLDESTVQEVGAAVADTARIASAADALANTQSAADSAAQAARQAEEALTAARQAHHVEGPRTEAAESVGVKRPPQVAPKADWESYVIAAGIATAEQVADMSKADLIDAAK